MATVHTINAKRKYEGATHAAIYCRVSSARKEQLKSLTAQISGLTNKIAYMPNYILFDSYVDIASGSSLSDRPEFQRLVDDCKSGRIKFVLVKNISRFSRDTVLALTAIKQIHSSGATIHFLQENVDSDNPDLEIYLAASLACAEMENTNRSENIKWGLKNRGLHGVSKSYNKICYGYQHDKEGNLIIKESEAENVRFIYNCYLDGHSVVSIIKELKKKKILSPSGKDAWSKKTVENILLNIKYTGTVILNIDEEQYVYSDHHPAIINPDAFEAVQTERDLRSNIVSDSNGHATRKSTKYSSIRTIRETYDSEKNKVELQNMLDEIKQMDFEMQHKREITLSSKKMTIDIYAKYYF